MAKLCYPVSSPTPRADTGGPASSQLMDLQLMLKVAEDVARGVLFLHNQGILHGDLKPNNILLKKVGNALTFHAAQAGHVQVSGTDILPGILFPSSDRRRHRRKAHRLRA